MRKKLVLIFFAVLCTASLAFPTDIGNYSVFFCRRS